MDNMKKSTMRLIMMIFMLSSLFAFGITGCTSEKVNQDSQNKVSTNSEEIIRNFIEAINKGEISNAEKLIAPGATYIRKNEDGTEYKTNKPDEIKNMIENFVNYDTNFTIDSITSQDDGTVLVKGAIKDFVTELKGIKQGIRYTKKYIIQNEKISSVEYEENIDDVAILNKRTEGVVGLRIELDNGKVVVKECSKGYPAEKAGLKPGDIIEAVDDMKVTEKKLGSDEAAYRIRGVVGTKVNLTINRNGEVINVDIDRIIGPKE